MNILVFKHENDGLKCKKCGENISLPLLDNILKNNSNQKDVLIELKNQIENIINLKDINNIIRKIKLIKSVLNDLIIENEKNQKEIQSFLNNNTNTKINNIINEKNNLNESNQKQNKFEIGNSSFNSNDTIILNNFIVSSVSKYSDSKKIANSILDSCKNWKNGKWAIYVGEKGKYFNVSYCNNLLGGYVGNTKIVISYFS